MKRYVFWFRSLIRRSLPSGITEILKMTLRIESVCVANCYEDIVRVPKSDSLS